MSFLPVCEGPRTLPGGGRDHAEGVLQRNRGRQRRGPVLEEGHLQGHLQTGQRGPRGLQVPQLSPRASTRVNSPPPPPPPSSRTMLWLNFSDFIEFKNILFCCCFFLPFSQLFL